MINATQYKIGQVLNVASARMETAQTKPPSHYTEATLMGDMLSAHKFAKTPEDREMLKKITGIGTSRTRGVIIESFVKRGFLVRTKRGKTIELKTSVEGSAILQGLPDVIKDVALTAKWERALAMVADGSARPEKLKEKVNQMLQQMVPQLLNSEK